MDAFLTTMLELLDVLFGGMLVDLVHYLLAVFALPAVLILSLAIAVWSFLG